MSSRPHLTFLLLAIAGTTPVAQAAPSHRSVANLVSGDECRGVAGFAAFSAELRKAADTQDVAALQRLFHPRGSMRVHGVYLSAAAADADRARFAPVWAEISDILNRGCARDGKRLILPAIASLAEQNVATETLIAIRPTWLHRQRSNHARSVRIETGEMLTEIVHGDIWTRVRLGTLEGKVRTADVRSPYDSRIELEWSDGRWTIIGFGSGV